MQYENSLRDSLYLVILVDVNLIFSPTCKAVLYCSERCQHQDLEGVSNTQHSHKLWCKVMKVFMEYSAALEDFPFQYTENMENAILRAYVNPSDVITLALHPQIESASSFVRLVSVDLCDWSEFYAWMGLSLSSLLALLFHWPLTIYHILNKLLPTKAEAQELDFLISHDIDKIVITMVGPNISPCVNGKKWLLSRRMLVSTWCATYHQYVKEAQFSGTFCLPDLVIGFNVGFVAYPTWKKTLEMLKVTPTVEDGLAALLSSVKM
ncbi:unnamed protein product [Hydatigera taeniaeformis]|uniref:MYND-type domain-containing protein n=1 Tax=Hydatigena taeniaeformis TaxID=6205 RepID=A0A0R3X4L5_HYDTA|nr:unnamed protein product [Hydatigera taeniaeformis]